MEKRKQTHMRLLALAMALGCVWLAGCAGKRDTAEPHLKEAARLLDRNKVEQSKAEIDSAIRIAPSRSSSYAVAALMFDRRKLYADEARVLEAMLERDKRSRLDEKLSRDQRAGLYVQLGVAYQKAKQLPAAERAYKDALALAPESPQLMNALGYFYADEGIKLPEALRLLKRAVELAPDDGGIIDSLGWARYRLGDYDAAIRNLTKAVELMPDEPELRYHLGAAYAKRGRGSAAEIELRKTLILDSNMKEAAALLRSLRK